MTPTFKRKKTRSVFRTILLPMVALVLIEALLLSLALTASGVVGQLDQNSEDILHKQVQNRANYLATTFSGWADLQRLSDLINDKTQAMLDAGTLDLERLDSDPHVCAPLLQDIVDDLISTLYAKRLTGIYVVFNTQDLSGAKDKDAIGQRTGVYIRDMDPTSPPAVKNEDLLWERCPVSVVQSMDIATDTAWRPQFSFPAGESDDIRGFFVQPLRAAYTARNAGTFTEARDYGYWGAASTVLLDSPWPAITYSIPLVLDDGTIYGVVGIGILVNYLQTMLPHNELFDEEDTGTYLLAVDESPADAVTSLTPMLLNGQTTQTYRLDHTIELEPYRDGLLYIANDGTEFYLAASGIPLYDADAPFASDHWILLGAVPTESLFAFSHRVLFLLILDIILMLAVGVAGSFVVSRGLSAPIHQLSTEVRQAQLSSADIPQLSPTGITEIDRFSSAITSLSRDVVNTSNRFLRILHLASVDISGFEVRQAEGAVYVTERFFSMLGLPDIPPNALTVERFLTILHHLNDTPNAEHSSDGSALYPIESPDGSLRYIRMDITEVDGGQVGIVEDVTAATLERLRAERERDYDLLTGLLSRRAFYAKVEKLFQSPDRLGFAALMMLDMDNLKFFNDHYGHDCGDAYIRQAGACFLENAPAEHSLCSRVSGDEFLLLFYGYEEPPVLRGAVERFCQAIRANTFHPAEGDGPVSVSASGGVAWYPQDAEEFHTLMRYADFAMYQAKRVQKGSVGLFDLAAYQRENFLDQSRQEFLRLLREEQVFFHFQPIVDAATGRVFAYEALMRTDLPTLQTPGSILRIARDMGRLQDVECLTWLRAPHFFRELLRQPGAEPQAFLFVNSIASQNMPPRAQERYFQEFHDLAARIVVEITEAEDMSAEALQNKRNAPGCSGLFALDDYGSGYSNERALLELSPQFVKVDLSIIRDIDQDVDKQQIVSNLVGYAHERGIRIVAEGVETPAELAKVLELGVDLLQGYLLSRPAPVPDPVPQSVLDQLEAFRAAAQV